MYNFALIPGVIKHFFAVMLLVTLCSCSYISRPEQPEQAKEPTTTPPLDSPLITLAKLLSATKPDKNYVTLLEIGNDALLTRVHLIRSARNSITIQTMIWANDETGRLFIYELIQAARRGVHVQLLIDHLASEQNIEIASFLAHAHPNLQIKFFNPVTGFWGQFKAEPSTLDKLYAAFFSFNRLNQRMHNKTFVVDGMIGITGGRNYQNAYYDNARRMNYKDRDILVIGPVVRDMTESFNCYWEYERAIRISDLADVKKYQGEGIDKKLQTREGFQLNGLFDDLDSQANNSELISQMTVRSLIEVDQAHFISDDPQKTERSMLRMESYSKITQELAALVSRANQSVYIQTPYLVLTYPAIELFKKLRKQFPEIDIRISTNSLAATDSWYVYALSYKQKKTFLDDLNFKLYEFKPLPGDLRTFMPTYDRVKAGALSWSGHQMLRLEPSTSQMPEDELSQENNKASIKGNEPYFCVHAKSMVVDDLVTFVGSYNLDPRSENINTESGLIIRDIDFSRILKNHIKLDMEPQNSWVIARKKRLTGIDEINAMFVELSDSMPLIDIWPFRYSASFELIEGKPSVDVDHPDFYKNYRDVGSFPQSGKEDLGKEIGARGTKAFLSFVKPLL